jgi:predicted nucleotidyltransferase
MALPPSAAIADFIERNTSSICNLLIEKESYEAIFDQIQRSVGCLRNHNFCMKYFNYGATNVASFLPLNLPLYSLLLFGIHPALMGSKVYIRPPVVLQPLYKDLLELLTLSNFGLELECCCASRSEFLEDIVRKSSVILFTGRISNADTVYRYVSPSSLFLFNGRGINPIIIAPDADISNALAQTIRVKLFNSGQDCAAPDIVIVHKSIISRVLDVLISALNNEYVGNFEFNSKIRVGPLIEPEQALKTAKALARSGGRLVYGGQINVFKNIVAPTILLFDSLDQVPIIEYFAPVFCVVEYDSDSDLKRFFRRDDYLNEAMYITCFGKSEYLREQKHSILLSEKTILDIEQAHLPYGGYSIGASFVGLRRNRLAKPILIPQEIKAAIDQGSISSSICKIEPSNIRTTQLPNNFYKLFSNTLKEVFNETLVFAFVFGSIAKQYATSDHDIDIFVCVSSQDIDKTSVFRQWVISLHQQLGFSYDDKYPVEVISLDKIREMLSELPRMILRALRKISAFQCFCGHEKAANLAA